MRKRARDGIEIAHEPDAAEGETGAGGNVHPKPRRQRQRVRHQAFAARFVDGRPGGIGHQHAKAAAARGYTSGQSCRTTPDYQYVCVECHVA